MLHVFLSFLLTGSSLSSSRAPDPPEGPFFISPAEFRVCDKLWTKPLRKTCFEWAIFSVNFSYTNSHVNSCSDLRCVSNQAVPFFPFLQTAEPSEPLLLFLLKRSLHMLPCERETMSHKRLNVYALFLHTHVSVYIFLACDGACRRSCWLG